MSGPRGSRPPVPRGDRAGGPRRRTLAFARLGIGTAAVIMASKVSRLPVLRQLVGPDYTGDGPLVLDAVRPEFFLGLALGLAAYDLERRRGARWGPGAVFALGWGAAAALVATEVAGNYFFTLTGGEALSADLLAFVAARIGSLAPMLADGVAGAGPGAAGVVALVAALGAVAAVPYWAAADPPRPGRPGPGPTLAWVACVALAAAPGFYLGGHPAARPMSLNLAASAVAGRADDALTALEGFEPAFPLETRLVPKDPGARPRDVVVIFLESTRASATGLHEPRPATTPFLDSIAGRSRVFERAYTVMPHTSKAVVATLCGVAPWPGLGVPEGEPDKGIPARCLGDLLGDHGYESAFFMPAPGDFEGHEQLATHFGIGTMVSQEDLAPTEEPGGYEFAETPYLGLEDDAVLPASRRWLAGVPAETPVFMTFLSVVPHHPYRAPPGFPRVEYEVGPGIPAREEYVRYLNCVRYSDRWVGKIFAQLEAAGRLENTVFLILGDHGEGFGEHGRFYHDRVIYNEGLQIPAVIFDPRRPVGSRPAGPVSNLDLLPTLADAAGYRLEGAGYAGVLASRRDPSRPVFSHCFRADACMAVLEDNWKYIHFFGTEPDRLFDLATDPGETRDRRAAHPARARAMLTKLRRWRLETLLTYRAYYGRSREPGGGAEAP